MAMMVDRSFRAGHLLGPLQPRAAAAAPAPGKPGRASSHTELAELAALLGSPPAMSPAGTLPSDSNILDLLLRSCGGLLPAAQTGAAAPWPDAALPVTPTTAQLSMWAPSPAPNSASSGEESAAETMAVEQDGGAAATLPELPEIDELDLPLTASACHGHGPSHSHSHSHSPTAADDELHQQYHEHGLAHRHHPGHPAGFGIDPAAVFASHTPPDSPESAYSMPGSPASSVEMQIATGHRRGHSLSGGSASDTDSSSSGGETASTQSGHSSASGRYHSNRRPATTTGINRSTRSGGGVQSGKAAARRTPVRKPANPRPKWKCSAEFLVNKIEPAERAKLARTQPQLHVPNPGDPITKPQEKALRAALRKIRNVASAQRSRRSQKDYIMTLEKRLADSEDENAELARANSSLSSSLNDALQQLARLRAALTGPTGGSAALLMVAACIGVGGVVPDGGKAEDAEDVFIATGPRQFQSRSLLAVGAGAGELGGIGMGWAAVLLCAACLTLAVMLLGAARRRYLATGTPVAVQMEDFASQLGDGAAITGPHPASSSRYSFAGDEDGSVFASEDDEDDEDDE